MILKVILFILVAEVFNTAGQVLFKRGTNTLEAPSLRSLASYLTFIRNILTVPAIWFGLGSLALGLIVWLMALAQGDLSLVFPIGSVQYILILISARIFLGENINRMKLAGTLLVMVGIILIAVS